MIGRSSSGIDFLNPSLVTGTQNHATTNIDVSAYDHVIVRGNTTSAYWFFIIADVKTGATQIFTATDTSAVLNATIQNGILTITSTQNSDYPFQMLGYTD